MSFQEIPDAWLHPAWPYGDDYLVDRAIKYRQRGWWEDLGLPEAQVRDLMLDSETFVPTQEEIEARVEGVRVKAEATTADGLRWAMREGFYMEMRWMPPNGLRVAPEIVYATVLGGPGSGKHTAQKFARDKLILRFGQSAVLDDQQVIDHSPAEEIKIGYRTEMDSSTSVGLYSFSLLAAMDYVKAVARTPGIKFAVSHRGIVSTTATGLVAQGEGDWRRLIEEMGSTSMLWHEKNLAEIAKNKALMDRGWHLVAEIVKAGRSKDMIPMDFWPMFDGYPIPIMVILDKSPETCWKLQEIPGKFRDDCRPGGSHPLTKEEMMALRLIYAMFYSTSPKSAVTVGQVWDEFDRDKAEREGESLLNGIAQVYTGWRR